MKKFLVYLIVTVSLSASFCPQSKVNVTIKVITNDLPLGSSVYIAGNNPTLGDWHPDLIQLDETENGVWQKKFSFNKGENLEFKFTLGSWETEALNDDGSVPSNYKLKVESDTTIEIRVNRWADVDEKKSFGQITGIVRYHLNLQGKDIKPRDVTVWLPPFYFIQPEKRYPVLYMHDGQNIFDPKTSFSGIDWQIDETADSLIRKGLIEEMIIVGIYNTPHRRSEYSENDTGYAYMDFIVDTLKPFIDRNYRTNPSRKYTATGGSSMGGLLSFMLAWEHPDVFSKAICMSPAFKVRRFNSVDNVASYNGQKKNIKFYFYNGGIGLDSLIQLGVDEMLTTLNEKGYEESEDYYFIQDISAEHNETAWSKRVWRALIFLFGTEEGKKLL
jgi:predicted alpha/beta superfamily hydrolase